jgi:uncharacterized protein
MPGMLDFAILAGDLGFILVGQVAGWPRLRAAAVAGAPRARIRGYAAVIAGEWLVTIAILLRWLMTGRPWAALWLGRPTSLGFAVAAGLTIATTGLLLVQMRRVARLSPRSRIAAGKGLGAVGPCLPRTPGEYRWFMALAITAGFCEELIYRGFVVWVLAFALGLYGAAAASVILFGLSHIYLGRTGAIRAMLTGTVLEGLVLATHSVVPSMVLHAIIDLAGGYTTYTLLGETAPAGSAA